MSLSELTENTNYTYKNKQTAKSAYVFNHTEVSANNSYHFHIVSPIGCMERTEHSTHTKLHHHDYFEVIYVISGTFIQKIENKTFTYKEGQCCILNRNVNHCEIFFDHADIVFMMLTDEFLAALCNSVFNTFLHKNSAKDFNSIFHLIQRNQKCKYYTAKEYISFTPFSNNMPDKETLEIVLNLINPSIITAPGSPHYVAGLIIDFFSRLESTSKYQKEVFRLVGEKEETLINEITHILLETHGKTSRSELQQLLNYNADYMNRVIKRATGMTLTDYKYFFLMQEAARLLTDTTLTIDKILLELDISNKSSFYKKFKNQFSVSPASYREIHQKNG